MRGLSERVIARVSKVTNGCEMWKWFFEREGAYHRAITAIVAHSRVFGLRNKI